MLKHNKNINPLLLVDVQSRPTKDLSTVTVKRPCFTAFSDILLRTFSVQVI